MTDSSLPKTRAVNCTKEPFDIYIGRRAGKFKEDSIWHNPFHIGKDGTREEVIEKCRAHIMDSPNLLAQLESLRGKALGCWCKPKACHGDIYVELLEGLAPSPVAAQIDLF